MAKVINLSVVEEEAELEKEVMEHPEPAARLDSGQARLQAMGYRQELRRSFGPLTSFATSLVLMANSGGITGKGVLLTLKSVRYLSACMLHTCLWAALPLRC